MEETLKKIPLFAGLPPEDLKELAKEVQSVKVTAGEELFKEGSPGRRAFVIQHGQLEILKDSVGRQVLLAVRGPGDVIGEMALLEEAPRSATVRARTDSEMLAIDKEELDRLLQTSPSALDAMFRSVMSRFRETQAMLRTSDKLAQLGTLTAGVAHELNNPAAAIKRSAERLRETLWKENEALKGLQSMDLSLETQSEVEKLEQLVRERVEAPIPLDSLTRSDHYQHIDEFLGSLTGEPFSTDQISSLVELGVNETELNTLQEKLTEDELVATLQWASLSYDVNHLLMEISTASVHISDIVGALKAYSYMDQAPVQAVDVHKSLEDTLIIMASKLKTGVTVEREYGEDIPMIQAYGSELNQVWTNLIDNAADAMEGKGLLTIRTRREGDWVVVEFEDSGSGIPPEAQPKIFDAFFTTKPPGVGTGLGLNISYNIIVHKHRGDIRFKSEPGRTCFAVWLPVNFEEH